MNKYIAIWVPLIILIGAIGVRIFGSDTPEVMSGTLITGIVAASALIGAIIKAGRTKG